MARKWNGSKWICQKERLAIYLRDGMACVYCGQGIEDGVTLSLDHVEPHCKGGSDDHSNLVTACKRCNTVRGNRSLWNFARDTAGYLGIEKEEISKHVNACLRRPMNRNRKMAHKLIARRGSYSAALATASETTE